MMNLTLDDVQAQLCLLQTAIVWQAYPMSVQCFDLRIVTEATELAANFAIAATNQQTMRAWEILGLVATEWKTDPQSREYFETKLIDKIITLLETRDE